MKTVTFVSKLSDLLVNLSAGWFGLVIFGIISKPRIIDIIISGVNGFVYFLLAVSIEDYEPN